MSAHKVRPDIEKELAMAFAAQFFWPRGGGAGGFFSFLAHATLAQSFFLEVQESYLEMFETIYSISKARPP